MFLDLKKKVVVVTGGSGFLGKQYCNAFLKNKSKVINLDIINKNKKVFFIKCDISKEDDLIAAKKKILKKFKKYFIKIVKSFPDKKFYIFLYKDLFKKKPSNLIIKIIK